MSSVSGSTADRRAQTDELRNAREENENREAEETKRHRREVKRLLENQDKEIQSIKETYEKKIEDLRNRSGSSLSEKDQANQGKIDKLRSMYADTIRRKTEENENKRQALEESYQSQISKDKKINDQQKQTLEKNFKNTISSREEQYNETTQKNREEMQGALRGRTNSLNQKMDKEVKAISEDRDRELMQSSKDIGQMKDYYRKKLGDTERASHDTIDRTNRNWQDNYTVQQVQNDQLIRGRDTEFQAARKSMQGKFENALQGKLDDVQQAHETLKEQATSRIDNEVRSVVGDNKKIQSERLVDAITNKRLRDLERKNVVESYEERFNRLEEARNGLVKQSNELNAERIAKANTGNSKILNEVVRKSQSDKRLAQEMWSSDKAMSKISQQDKIDYLTKRTNLRVNQIVKSTAEAQEVEQRQHEESLNSLKDSYASELSKQRQVQMEQLQDIYVRMGQRLKDVESRYDEKFEKTVNGYESKIGQMEEKFKKDLDSQAKAYETRIAAHGKQEQTEQKSQQIKFESKVSQVQELHDKEIDRLQKRHQEQMASLAQKMNYLKKG
jgi:hypothetical protein